MARTSHHKIARHKPAMELSPQQAEQFRRQITRETWRYAAQGPFSEKAKSQVYKLGSASARPARSGLGFGTKVALLMILMAVGSAAAWRVLDLRLPALHRGSAAGPADARLPGAAPGVAQRPPGNGADLAPPIVPENWLRMCLRRN